MPRHDNSAPLTPDFVFSHGVGFIKAELSQSGRGYFRPYINERDVLNTLVSPVTKPAYRLGLTVIAAAVIGLATVTCVSSLIIAACSAPFNPSFAFKTLVVALSALTAALIATVATVAFAISAVLSIPEAIVKNFTRTGTSIVGLFSKPDESQFIHFENEDLCGGLHPK